METAQTIIKDALQEALVQGSEQPITADEFESGVRYLNRMMSGWSARGIDMGYVDVTYPGDEITIIDGAMECVVFNLALKLAPQYDIPISQDLRINARDSFRAIRRITTEIKPTLLPSTLHMGSGNSYNNNYNYEDEYFNETKAPANSYDMKVGQIDSYSVDFNLYLLNNETVSSFAITEESLLTVNDSAELSGVITFIVKANTVGVGKLCFNVTTSDGRAIPHTLNYDITEAC